MTSYSPRKTPPNINLFPLDHVISIIYYYYYYYCYYIFKINSTEGNLSMIISQQVLKRKSRYLVRNEDLIENELEEIDGDDGNAGDNVWLKSSHLDLFITLLLSGKILKIEEIRWDDVDCKGDYRTSGKECWETEVTILIW